MSAIPEMQRLRQEYCEFKAGTYFLVIYLTCLNMEWMDGWMDRRLLERMSPLKDDSETRIEPGSVHYPSLVPLPRRLV